MLINSQESLSQQNFKHILELYENDLPSFVCFNSEIDLLQHQWKATPKLTALHNTPDQNVAHTDCDLFPDVHTSLCIMGTLPVTSCECQHSIRMLQVIKSPLRSIMLQEHLIGLGLVASFLSISCYH